MSPETLSTSPYNAIYRKIIQPILVPRLSVLHCKSLQLHFQCTTVSILVAIAQKGTFYVPTKRHDVPIGWEVFFVIPTQTTEALRL